MTSSLSFTVWPCYNLNECPVLGFMSRPVCSLITTKRENGRVGVQTNALVEHIILLLRKWPFTESESLSDLVAFGVKRNSGAWLSPYAVVCLCLTVNGNWQVTESSVIAIEQ